MPETPVTIPVATSNPLPSWWRWTTLVLALLAIVGSETLLRQSLTGVTLPGCDGSSSSCDQVLSSRFSAVFHVPVGGLALLLYGSVFLMLVIEQFRAREPANLPVWIWSLLVFAGTSAIIAAIWFVFVQAVLLKAFCAYCCATHAVGVLLSSLILIAAWSRMARRVWVTCVLLGLVAAIAFAAAQLLGPSPRSMRVQQLGGIPDIDTGPGPDRTISILAGRVRLNPHDYPVLGSPDAPHVAVYLYDYTCTHCRDMARILHAARERYGNQLAIVLLPVPLDSACNPNIRETQPVHAGACELAKLTMGLWRVEPEKVSDVHALLMRDRAAPSPETAAAELLKIVRPESLAAAQTDRWPSEQIARNVRVLELTGSGAIPRLILGPIIISSRPATPEELFELLEKQTSLRPALMKSDEPRP